MISVENKKTQSEPQTQEEDLDDLLYAVYDVSDMKHQILTAYFPHTFG